MEPAILISCVWAALILVIVAYVIYRLATDRRGNVERHPLYPLVSRSSDGMFPSKSEPRAWFTYIAVASGYGMFLGLLAFELFNLKPPALLIAIFGPAIMVGIGLLAVGLLKREIPK